jgi:hypothetical protein
MSKKDTSFAYKDTVKSGNMVKDKCSTAVSHVFENQNFASQKFKTKTPQPPAAKENARPVGFEQQTFKKPV